MAIPLWVITDPVSDLHEVAERYGKESLCFEVNLKKDIKPEELASANWREGYWLFDVQNDWVDQNLGQIKLGPQFAFISGHLNDSGENAGYFIRDWDGWNRENFEQKLQDQTETLQINYHRGILKDEICGSSGLEFIERQLRDIQNEDPLLNTDQASVPKSMKLRWQSLSSLFREPLSYFNHFESRVAEKQISLRTLLLHCADSAVFMQSGAKVEDDVLGIYRGLVGQMTYGLEWHHEISIQNKALLFLTFYIVFRNLLIHLVHQMDNVSNALRMQADKEKGVGKWEESEGSLCLEISESAGFYNLFSQFCSLGDRPGPVEALAFFLSPNNTVETEQSKRFDSDWFSISLDGQDGVNIKLRSAKHSNSK